MKIKLTEKSLAALELPEGKAQVVVWDTELIGFGVVVGKLARKFIVDARVDGQKRRKAVAVAGRVREDGHVWTVSLARQRAKEILGRMAAGVDPNSGRGLTGPTLRDAMETHVAKMKKKHRAERSIETLEYELTKYMADWLDRPLEELSGAVLVKMHEAIKNQAAPRKGTNPRNAKGAPVANRVIAHVSACWRSHNKKLEGKLGTWNPASSVDRDTLKPKRVRIADEALPGYAARVATMRSPVRRDGLMFALYTGLRHEDVRTVRFEYVDWNARTLLLPDPKGGEGASFTIPLSATPFAILERRHRDNAGDIGAGDDGWAFPTLKGDTVGPVDNLRQKKGKNVRFPVEDVHTLRRTWESIAQEEGISELDQHVLSNQSAEFGHRDHRNRCMTIAWFGHGDRSEATLVGPT